MRTATSKTSKEKKIPQNDANIPDKRPPPVTLEDKEKCLKDSVRLKKSPDFFTLNLFIYKWRIIALPYYVGFCHIST